MFYDSDTVSFFDDFAIDVLVDNTTTLKAIFDEQSLEIDTGFGPEITASNPELKMVSADVDTYITKASTIKVNTVVYRVEDLLADGTGITVVQLIK